MQICILKYVLKGKCYLDAFKIDVNYVQMISFKGEWLLIYGVGCDEVPNALIWNSEGVLHLHVYQFPCHLTLINCLWDFTLGCPVGQNMLFCRYCCNTLSIRVLVFIQRFLRDYIFMIYLSKGQIFWFENTETNFVFHNIFLSKLPWRPRKCY